MRAGILVVKSCVVTAGGLICLGGGNIWDRGLSYHERGISLDLNYAISSSSSRDVKNSKTALDHLNDLGLSQ